MLKKFRMQHCLSMLVACFAAIPYCFMNVGADIVQPLDEAEIVSTLLQPGELSRIEEGGNLVYLSSRAIKALTDVATHAKEQEQSVQAVEDVLARVDAGYHTAGSAETLLAIEAASLYATEQNVSDVTEVFAEYEAALLQGDASFVSKRTCPPLLKKECLEVANLCVKNSCILGNEKICGSLKVGGNINLTKDCPCCPCKPNVVGTVSGAFHPGAKVIDARLDLSVDFDFPAEPPFPGVTLEQGCFVVENPFKDPRACVVNGKKSVEVLTTSISGIKGIVAHDSLLTQYATEFTIAVGYPCFSEPPVIVVEYNNQKQGAALYSLTNIPFEANTLFNVFATVANVQQSFAIVRVLFYFSGSGNDGFEDDSCYQQLLLHLKEIINGGSLSLRIFGSSS